MRMRMRARTSSRRPRFAALVAAVLGALPMLAFGQWCEDNAPEDPDTARTYSVWLVDATNEISFKAQDLYMKSSMAKVELIRAMRGWADMEVSTSPTPEDGTTPPANYHSTATRLCGLLKAAIDIEVVQPGICEASLESDLSTKLRHSWGFMANTQVDQDTVCLRKLTNAHATFTTLYEEFPENHGYKAMTKLLREAFEAATPYDLDDATDGKTIPYDDGSHYFGHAVRSELGIAVAFARMSKGVEKYVSEPVKVVTSIFLLASLSVAKLGEALLMILFVLAVFWCGYQLLFKGAQISDLVSGLGQVLITTLFFWWLLSPTTYMHSVMGEDGNPVEKRIDAPRIMLLTIGLQTFFQAQMYNVICNNEAGDSPLRVDMERNQHEMTSQIDKFVCDGDGNSSLAFVDTFNPGGIFAYGAESAATIYNIPKELSANMPDVGFLKMLASNDWMEYLMAVLLCTLTALFIVMVYLLITLAILFVWMQGYVIAAMGVFVLGFGAHEWSRDKAVLYLWTCVGWGVRVSLIFMLFFIFQSAFQAALHASELDRLHQGSDLEVISIFMYCVIRLIEPMAIASLTLGITRSIGQLIGGVGGTEAAQSMMQMGSRLTSAGLGKIATVTSAATVGPMLAGAKQAGGLLTASGAAALGAGAVVGTAAVGAVAGAGSTMMSMGRDAIASQGPGGGSRHSPGGMRSTYRGTIGQGIKEGAQARLAEKRGTSSLREGMKQGGSQGWSGSRAAFKEASSRAPSSSSRARNSARATVKFWTPG